MGAEDVHGAGLEFKFLGGPTFGNVKKEQSN